MTDQTPDVPHVDPLPAPIESTANLSDFYTTKRFREIFEHEENADLARAFTVGLAANDTDPRPIVAEEDVEDVEDVEEGDEDGPAVTLATDFEPAADDGVNYTDAYGDSLRVMYGEQICERHGREPFLAFQTEDGSTVVMPVEHAEEFVAWLATRVAKGQGRSGK